MRRLKESTNSQSDEQCDSTPNADKSPIDFSLISQALKENVPVEWCSEATVSPPHTIEPYAGSGETLARRVPKTIKLTNMFIDVAGRQVEASGIVVHPLAACSNHAFELCRYSSIPPTDFAYLRLGSFAHK